MRIGILIEQYQLGGPDTVIAQILRKWPADKDLFFLLANRAHADAQPTINAGASVANKWLLLPTIDLADLRARCNATVYWTYAGTALFRMLKYPLMMFNAMVIAIFLRKLQLDSILVINGGYPGGDTSRAAIFGAKLSGIRMIAMAVHNMPTPPRRGTKLMERIIDSYIDEFSTMVCVSQKGLDEMRRTRHFRQDGLVIYNGYAQECIYKRNRNDVIKEFGLSHNTWILGMVGSYEERKGHRTLFKALANVLQNIPETRLLIFGTGNSSEVRRINELIEEYRLKDVVLLCGFRSNVVQYLGALDLLVFPSIESESLPMAIIEAMALRVPVIASDVGGTRELISNGVTGALINPGDDLALAERLKTVHMKPEIAKTWAQEAATIYLDRFTADKMAKEYWKLLQPKAIL
jgi:L-malate glycosyltransferase